MSFSRRHSPRCGQLYDIDLRLRPDGAKGLMSSSLAGFRRYEREQAWTWEHQALTRARFVAGDPAIGAAFEAERNAILCLPRERAKLAADVVDMRRRMLAGHPNPTALFDLKTVVHSQRLRYAAQQRNKAQVFSALNLL